MSVLKHQDEVRVLGNKQHCLMKEKDVRFTLFLTVNRSQVNILCWEHLLSPQIISALFRIFVIVLLLVKFEYFLT